MELKITIPDKAPKYFSQEELVKEAEEAVETRLRQRIMRWAYLGKLAESRKSK